MKPHIRFDRRLKKWVVISNAHLFGVLVCLNAKSPHEAFNQHLQYFKSRSHHEKITEFKAGQVKGEF